MSTFDPSRSPVPTTCGPSGAAEAIPSGMVTVGFQSTIVSTQSTPREYSECHRVSDGIPSGMVPVGFCGEESGDRCAEHGRSKTGRTLARDDCTARCDNGSIYRTMTRIIGWRY